MEPGTDLLPPARHLIRAVLAGDIQEVDAALAHGADVQATYPPDAWGGAEAACVVQIAAQRWDTGMVLHLFRRGAYPLILDGRGRTLLHLAAASELPKRGAFSDLLERALLPAGIPVNASTSNNLATALHDAIRTRKPARVIRALLAAGADPDLSEWLARNAPMLAGEYLHWSALRVLLERNPSGAPDAMQWAVTACANQQDWCLTTGAALESWRTTARLRRVLLLCMRYGADLNTPYMDGTGTGAHAAAACGDTRWLNLLLRMGANTEPADHYGLTPLHAAATRGRVDAAAALLRHGANVDSRDSRGQTPMMCAAAACAHGMIEYLVGEGADIRAMSKDGASVLHHAGSTSAEAEDGYERTVTTCIRLGADPSARDHEGETALFRLARRGAVQRLRVLLQHGADPTVRAGSGESVEDAARIGNGVTPPRRAQEVLALLAAWSARRALVAATPVRR